MTNTEETIYATRMGGNTSVLIGVLIQNPAAKMVVHTYDFAKELSRKYQLPMNRFITVSNLEDGLCGFRGPVVFDLPAIAYLIKMEVEHILKDKHTVPQKCGACNLHDGWAPMGCILPKGHTGPHIPYDRRKL